MNTHTKVDIETVEYECAERDCVHVSPIGRDECPKYAGIPVTAAGEEWARRSIEECEGLIREHANPDHLVYEPHNDDLHPVTAFRRVRRRKPGPWEPVPTEGEAS